MLVRVILVLSALLLSSSSFGRCSNIAHINLSPSMHLTQPFSVEKVSRDSASDMFQYYFFFGRSHASVERSKWSHAPLPAHRLRRSTGVAPSHAPARSYHHRHGSHAKHHRSKHHRKRPHAEPPTLPIPHPGQDCSEYSCSDPLTEAPIGSPCGCVYPIQVIISLGVPPYQLFSLVAELEVEVAVGTYLKQSQVRIMGANPDEQNPGRTVVSIYLVPLGEKFDNMTAFLTYERIWQKKVILNTSLFGDYDVIDVQYPGLPPAPPPSASSPHGGFGLPFTANVPTSKKRKMDPKIIILIACSSFVLVLWCASLIYAILHWRRLRRRSNPFGLAFNAPVIKGAGMSSITSSNFSSLASVSLFSNMANCPPSLRTFPLAQLERATQRFSSKKILGEGGSGRVYAGILDDGIEVAVKLLVRKDQSGDREFVAEVEMLSRLHHRNLVKLVGICIENNIRCLVYELVHNGSVESHLHGIDRARAPLSWDARMKIALGSARALAYLHEDSNPHVIHRDFKASNILLEDDFTPRVSDFGLAREASDRNLHISTQVMGTFGYVAPEYAMTGHLLVKSDVYSYGVVLLELLSGRKPVYINELQRPENLVTWARPLLTSKEGLQHLIDPALNGGYDPNDMARVAAIASMCVHGEAAQRPFMGEVVQALKLVCRESETEEAFEDSHSRRGSSLGPEYDSREFGLDGSWYFAGSPHSAPARPAAAFMSMACSSDDRTRPPSSPNARRSLSGPLKMPNRGAGFFRLRGSTSEHGRRTSIRETPGINYDNAV